MIKFSWAEKLRDKLNGDLGTKTNRSITMKILKGLLRLILFAIFVTPVFFLIMFAELGNEHPADNNIIIEWLSKHFRGL